MSLIEPRPDPSAPVFRPFLGQPPADRPSPWPAIDGALLDDTSIAVPPFPLDVLPPPWRIWIADTARSMNVPADYVAQAVLAAVAGICGAGVWVTVSPVWTSPLSLWLAAVGAPSSGKSPALAAVHGLLRSLERDTANVGQPAPRRRPGIVGDGSFDSLIDTALANQRGVVLWRDEPAGCFAPLLAGAAVRALDRFPVSIMGTLEPDRLAATVQRHDEALAARFLYAWPAPPPFQPLAGRQPADDEAALALLRAIHDRAGTMRAALTLPIDDDGLAALDGFLAGLHVDQRAAEGLEAAWLGKGQGLLPRLAAILHLLDWSAAARVDPAAALGDIGRGAVERAIALWSGYWRLHARAFFERAAPSDLDSRARRVVRWLKACGAREISREDV
ncbi:MAG: DUF3987 domain-containing protein, partial [Alphaproteobacteria bacterium]|nr:DUF3987 domain-containing protein [Alphaproteobacteria bacterium]